MARRDAIRSLAGPPAIGLARSIEASPALLRRLRTVPLPAKRLVVRHLRAERLPPHVVAECRGITFDLDLNEDVQRKIYFECYERREVRWALRQLPARGGVCIDAGAYVGVYSLSFARHLDRDGIVHAFEPDATNFERLQRNCGLNRFGSKVRPHQIALSDRDDQALFFRNTSAIGRPYGSLAHLEGPPGASEPVPTLSLDTFLRREQIEHVDLLKVDVEAHELELLDGAKGALAESIFGAVLIEFNGVRHAERGTKLNTFLAALSDHGYEPFGLNLSLLRLMQRGVVSGNGVCTNLLFRPRRTVTRAAR